MGESLTSNEGCATVPLVELLRGVPRDARYSYTEPDSLKATHFIPIGRYATEAADEIDRLTKREAELVGLLRECRKVMKADSLHRGNPDRRQLATRISAALKEQP